MITVKCKGFVFHGFREIKNEDVSHSRKVFTRNVWLLYFIRILFGHKLCGIDAVWWRKISVANVTTLVKCCNNFGPFTIYVWKLNECRTLNIFYCISLTLKYHSNDRIFSWVGSVEREILKIACSFAESRLSQSKYTIYNLIILHKSSDFKNFQTLQRQLKRSHIIGEVYVNKNNWIKLLIFLIFRWLGSQNTCDANMSIACQSYLHLSQCKRGIK